MTICIAMVCTEADSEKPAVLFATDKQFTQGTLTSTGQKIYTIELDDLEGSPGFVFAIAGDIYVAEEAVHAIYSFIEDNIEDDTEDGIKDNRSSVDFLVLNKEALGDVIFDVYNKYRNRGYPDSKFEILIGAADNESAVIVHIKHNGKVYLCSDFAIIGHGLYSGGLLLLNEFYREGLTDGGAARLACQVINLVSKIDGTINNYIDYTIAFDNSVLNYEAEALENIDKDGLKYWNLIVNIYLKLQKDYELYSKLVDYLAQI